MCGIAGSLALALEADPDEEWVARATQRISHRGPDDEGFYSDPDVALGYKRLAIIDLSPGGHQPMRSADGRYWMVFNGEIYNYVELGQELLEQGVRLQSSSDSEVLLEAYARTGKDVVHRLRGMYAFAIWDTWTRELFCARDPFGIKPFYYRVDRGPALGAGQAGEDSAAATWGSSGDQAAGWAAAGQAPAADQGPATGWDSPGQVGSWGGAGQGETLGWDSAGQTPAWGADGSESSRPAWQPDSATSAGSTWGVAAGPDEGSGTTWGSGEEMPAGWGSAGTAQEWDASAGWSLGDSTDPGAGRASGAGWESGAGRDGAWGAGPDPEPPSGGPDAPVDWFTPLNSPDPRTPGPSQSPGPAASSPGRAGDLWTPRGPGTSHAPGYPLPAGYGAGPEPGAAESVAGPHPGYAGAGAQPGYPWSTPGAQPGYPASGHGPQSGYPAYGPASQPGPSPSPGRGAWEGFPAGAHQGALAGRGTPGQVDRVLRFASERKALAEPGELGALDPACVRRYLAFQYVPAPDTITPPIRVLPPGHALVASPEGRVDVYRYWRADLRPAHSPSESTPRRILAAMRDSVAVHLRSDAPLGAFLSGGIDSAAICALAAEHRPDLLTFTVGFEREGYSEIDRAQETAAALGVKSIPYLISPGEFFHYLPQILWHLDDPMADAAAIPLWFVAREASRHVKVVLSGEGADELFGGYAIYHQPGVVRAGERLPEWGRMPIRRAAAMIPAGVRGKGLLERTSTPLRHRYIGNAHVYGADEVDMIAPPGESSPWEVTGPIYDQAEEAGLDDVSTMQLVDINTWLAGDILVKADRMTMAHSLELRVPFLDREVMAVAARLAREEKIGSGTTKLALRMAMSEVLPKAAAERAKLGFPVPIGHWLKGEAYGFAEWLLREAQTGEWINREEALRMLAGFRNDDPAVSWRHVWLLIVFSLWHQIFVEHVYDPVALGWERQAGVAR